MNACLGNISSILLNSRICSGLRRCGVRQGKVFLTQSQAPKTRSSMFKKYSLHRRSFQTSVPLFAKRNTKPTKIPSPTNIPTCAAAEKRASANNAPSAEQQAVTVGPYKFPVIAGENGPQWYSDQLQKWGEEPPFLDRQNALFTLLRNTYLSTSSSAKPVVTVATTSSGFGKTRILVEWIAQIFKHPFIVAAFLANKQQLDNLPETTTIISVEEQIKAAIESDNDPTLKERGNFLLRLFNTGISGSIITTYTLRNRRISELISGMDVLSEAQVHQVCKAILISGIISSGSPFKEEDIAHISIPKLAEAFLKSTQTNTSWPNFVTNTRPKPLLVINIDQVQELIRKSTARANKNLAFEIASVLLNWLGRDSLIINMVGLCVGNLTTLQDQAQFSLVPYLPMDPLLKQQYLSEVCDKVLKKKLFSVGSSDCFSKVLSAQLHELWVTACGIPRTIEILVDQLRRPELQLAALAKLELGDIERIRQAISHNNQFVDIKTTIGTELTEKQWNQLLLDFVFCKQRSPATPVGNSTFEELEASVYIIPFRFTQPGPTLATQNYKRNYTIPFYLYSEEIRTTAIQAFQGDYSDEQNPHNIPREPFTITLERVLKVYGRSVIDEKETQKPANKERGRIIFKGDPNNNAGQILEEAVAASLWLRYLDAIGFERNSETPISMVWPDLNYTKLYASWRGVIKFSNQGLVYEKPPKKSTLQKHAEFDNYVEYLAQNHYIAINMSNTQFADVVAPLYDKQGNFMKLLCIQCQYAKEGSSKIQPSFVHKQMSCILQDSNRIVVILAPNINSQQLFSARSSIKSQMNDFERWERNNSFKLATGDKLLSDWFLHVFEDAFLDRDE